jgi:hypothetical protein
MNVLIADDSFPMRRMIRRELRQRLFPPRPGVLQAASRRLERTPIGSNSLTAPRAIWPIIKA